MWLGCFYLSLPLGQAIGYLFGGGLGDSVGWRAAFWIEAGLGLPPLLFLLAAAPVAVAQHSRKGSRSRAGLVQQEEQRQQQGHGSQEQEQEERVDGEEVACLEAGAENSAGGYGTTAAAPAATAGAMALPDHPQQPQRWRSWLGWAPLLWHHLRQLAKEPMALAAIAGLTLWNGMIGCWVREEKGCGGGGIWGCPVQPAARCQPAAQPAAQC